jgi:hypothetical protein
MCALLLLSMREIDMRAMKYLVDDNNGVYLFPQEQTHKYIAEDLKIKPIRGGFVQFVGGKFKCFGEAFSLSLHSDPEKDAELINRMLNEDERP